MIQRYNIIIKYEALFYLIQQFQATLNNQTAFLAKHTLYQKGMNNKKLCFILIRLFRIAREVFFLAKQLLQEVRRIQLQNECINSRNQYVILIQQNPECSKFDSKKGKKQNQQNAANNQKLSQVQLKCIYLRKHQNILIQPFRKTLKIQIITYFNSNNLIYFEQYNNLQKIQKSEEACILKNHLLFFKKVNNKFHNLQIQNNPELPYNYTLKGNHKLQQFAYVKCDAIIIEINKFEEALFNFDLAATKRAKD
ncbi:unnamed protein product [Paramecium octaurelia]|uniref:Uncharacterized protein n=1 Tax=Paramecium octaurelia TaxID=43137 RepID=A0A8S1V7A4_PAROT|nr:unnamed protein product [Paramecium octaurelia]